MEGATIDIANLAACRVIPVVATRDIESTIKLALALRRGGMRAIEITLRTDSALECIRALRLEVPAMLVAAGTVTNPAQLDQALEAGAQLVFSPGSTEPLLQAASQAGIDFIPGVATASEVMLGLQHGFELFKLFPADAAGGTKLLRSLTGPFPHVRFCPTGGLNRENFRDYLALDNVLCCGGSWMATADLLAREQWDTIEELAREAMSTP